MTYIISALDIPDETTVYYTFVKECISRAPLIGNKFESDTRQFHQLILLSTQGKPLHEWIKPLIKNTNGRINMAALRAHYQGEEDLTRRISEAERLRDSLHYQNERDLPFNFYLSKMQHIFNLFEENKEP